MLPMTHSPRGLSIVVNQGNGSQLRTDFLCPATHQVFPMITGATMHNHIGFLFSALFTSEYRSGAL